MSRQLTVLAIGAAGLCLLARRSESFAASVRATALRPPQSGERGRPQAPYDHPSPPHDDDGARLERGRAVRGPEERRESDGGQLRLGALHDGQADGSPNASWLSAGTSDSVFLRILEASLVFGLSGSPVWPSH